MPTTPTPPAEPVETKVKAATGVAAVLAVIVTVLNAAAADSSLLGSLPAWLQGVVLLLAPPLATFYAGWKARHTPRPDAPEPGGGSTIVTP